MLFRLIAAFLLLTCISAHAANDPCSGKKCDFSHCAGDIIVCNDGSVSGSKRGCSAEMGGGISPRQLLTQPQLKSAAPGDCSSRSGNVCTGQRGGRYCMTDAWNKSYLKR